jgi:hypothetical protein
MSVVSLSALEAHARAYFAGHECFSLSWLPGPTPVILPEFRVLHFLAGPRFGTPVYVSVGASLVRPGYHREFVLTPPSADPSHVETLAMVAYYHHAHGLDIGHTFPVGRPCFPGGAADHFLVSLPYPFGPELEQCLTAGHDTQFLWLLPVYKSEVRFRHAHDLEALELLFEDPPINILDGRRPPVA